MTKIIKKLWTLLMVLTLALPIVYAAAAEDGTVSIPYVDGAGKTQGSRHAPSCSAAMKTRRWATAGTWYRERSAFPRA